MLAGGALALGRGRAETGLSHTALAGGQCRRRSGLRLSSACAGSAANAVADIPAALGPVFTDSVVAAVRSDMTFIAMMSHPLQTQTAPALWTSLKMDSPSSRTSRGRSSQTSPHGMGSGIALILLGGISLFQAWRTCSTQQRISRTNPRNHLMLIFFPNDRCDLAQAATVHPVCRPHPTRRGPTGSPVLQQRSLPPSLRARLWVGAGEDCVIPAWRCWPTNDRACSRSAVRCLAQSSKLVGAVIQARWSVTGHHCCRRPSVFGFTRSQYSKHGGADSNGHQL